MSAYAKRLCTNWGSPNDTWQYQRSDLWLGQPQRQITGCITWSKIITSPSSTVSASKFWSSASSAHPLPAKTGDLAWTLHLYWKSEQRDQLAPTWDISSKRVTSLASISSFSTDLKRIQSPHNLFRDFRADWTFGQVAEINKSACHLAITSEDFSNSQELGAALWHSSSWSVLRARVS